MYKHSSVPLNKQFNMFRLQTVVTECGALLISLKLYHNIFHSDLWPTSFCVKATLAQKMFLALKDCRLFGHEVS